MATNQQELHALLNAKTALGGAAIQLERAMAENPPFSTRTEDLRDIKVEILHLKERVGRLENS